MTFSRSTDEAPHRLTSGVHPSYLEEARCHGALFHKRASTEASEAFGHHAQSAARSLDDNHVGTEHITLSLFRFGPNATRTALEQSGIPQEGFLAVLDQEPGPSPAGPIPYTPRALMIAGLAVSESDRLGADRVGLEHLLLGVIRESERWERDHAWGPHHLRAAARAVGATLQTIESSLMQLSWAPQDRIVGT